LKDCYAEPGSRFSTGPGFSVVPRTLPDMSYNSPELFHFVGWKHPSNHEKNYDVREKIIDGGFLRNGSNLDPRWGPTPMELTGSGLHERIKGYSLKRHVVQLNRRTKTTRTYGNVCALPPPA
jgi:hypothetical protein